MDWNDFAKRLTLELSRLPVTSFLIVQGPSGLPYVQAMRAEGVLDAEAVGSAFLPRPLAPRQERRLRALGWEPPDEEERKNWWHQFTLRDRGGRALAEQLEACALLAGLMVGAFRDVYRIESPLELVYQASRSGPEGGPLALPGLGIPLAVPDAEGRRAARPARPAGSTLETALAEARERGDQHGYLELLARAVLYLPAPGDPGSAEHQFATAQFGDGTFVLAFTSPEAMDRSLQGQAVHHRQASLSELSRHWPHPDWQLAVNPGLPSASYLDANALFEPEEPRKPAGPTPPAPSDVHVAGASSRTRTRGVKPGPGGSTGGRRAPRPPESPASPRTGSPAPSDVPAASQAPTRPPGDSPAPRPAAPPPPRRPEAPAARETVGDPRGIPVLGRGGSPNPSRETPSDPQGLPVAPLYGRREAAETVSRHHAAPVAPPSTAPSAPDAAQNPPPGAPSGRPEKPTAAQATPTYTQDRASTSQSAVRDTRPEPAAQHAGPGVGMDAPSRPPSAPVGRGQGPRVRTQDIPVAGRERGGAGEKREAPAKEPAQKSQAPPDGASQAVVMQKVVRPEHVPHYLEGGYDLVAGYVHRAKDVREMTTPGALIRGLGLVYEGSPFSPADEEIYAIRWPAVKPPLFRRPLGGIDEWSMGIIPGGWVIEKAPFPGSGYAPGDGPAIPEFKIESQRLPHGAELHRLAADGREALVASYDADLRRWLVKLPERPGERA
ncbi:TY-Chap domain-containing protein [Actinomadura sp. 3N407]|uniref:SseB family protein n=1 Tax=Actinomadura sp. 3N407 TaxID=3457423 RepID=UPI003FCE8E70